MEELPRSGAGSYVRVRERRARDRPTEHYERARSSSPSLRPLFLVTVKQRPFASLATTKAQPESTPSRCHVCHVLVFHFGSLSFDSSPYSLFKSDYLSTSFDRYLYWLWKWISRWFVIARPKERPKGGNSSPPFSNDLNLARYSLLVIEWLGSSAQPC